MKSSIEGQTRRKILIKGGVGVNLKEKGKIVRKNMRGNTVGKDIVQLNLVITKQGDKPISDFIKPVEAKKEKTEEKESAKERMIKESLENVGNVELAEEAKNIKGKVRG